MTRGAPPDGWQGAGHACVLVACITSGCAPRASARGAPRAPPSRRRKRRALQRALPSGPAPRLRCRPLQPCMYFTKAPLGESVSVREAAAGAQRAGPRRLKNEREEALPTIPINPTTCYCAPTAMRTAAPRAGRRLSVCTAACPLLAARRAALCARTKLLHGAV